MPSATNPASSPVVSKRMPMTCMRCGTTRLVTRKYFLRVQKKVTPPLCNTCRKQLWIQRYRNGEVSFTPKNQTQPRYRIKTMQAPCGTIEEIDYGAWKRCKPGDKCQYYWECLSKCAAKQWQGWREVDGSDAALSKHISGETCDFELPNGGAAQSGESDVSSAS